MTSEYRRSAALQLAGAAVGTGPLDLPFWGRGVSTAWHLYIEDSEILTNQVDLSQLSQVQVGIGYQSFLVTPAAPEPRPARAAPAALDAKRMAPLSR